MCWWDKKGVEAQKNGSIRGLPQAEGLIGAQRLLLFRAPPRRRAKGCT